MRGRGLAVVGALALLALVVPLASLVAAVRGDRPAPPPSDVDSAYAVDGELTCDSAVQQVATLPLEAEPTALLICAAPGSTVPWTAPAELVEGDLTVLVEALSGLERAPLEPYECTFQGGPGYDLLLEFSRDRFARIQGDTGGCGVVTTASGEWFGAQDVLDAAIELVEQQRAATEPPDTVTPVDLGCNAGRDSGLGRPLSLTGDVADLTRLVSCSQGADERRQFPPGTELASSDVRALAADMAAHAFEDTSGPPLRCPGGRDRSYAQHLVGQTRWGDLLVAYGTCRQFTIPGDPVRWWSPMPDSQRILDDLRR